MIYYCPSCPVDEPKPGSCGICGRVLIPRLPPKPRKPKEKK